MLDSGPHAYWRLDETSGSGTAADSVLANEGTDNATYSAVTLGQDAGPLAGSSATAATFNGTSSYVTLPQGLVSAAAIPDRLAVVQDQQPPTGCCCSYENSAAQRGLDHGQLRCRRSTSAATGS